MPRVRRMQGGDSGAAQPGHSAILMELISADGKECSETMFTQFVDELLDLTASHKGQKAGYARMGDGHCCCCCCSCGCGGGRDEN